MHRYLLSFALLVACGCAATDACGQSFGPWRIPSRPAQYCGHGFGAGHHAPMVRGACGPTLRVQRVVSMPSVSMSCGAMHQPVMCPSGAGSTHFQPMVQHYSVRSNPQSVQQAEPAFAAPRQPVFAPPAKQSAAKQSAPKSKKQVADLPASLQPTASATKPQQPVQKPARAPARESLPEPMMPGADSLPPGDQNRDDQQASYDFWSGF